MAISLLELGHLVFVWLGELLILIDAVLSMLLIPALPRLEEAKLHLLSRETAPSVVRIKAAWRSFTIETVAGFAAEAVGKVPRLGLELLERLITLVLHVLQVTVGHEQVPPLKFPPILLRVSFLGGSV